VALMRYLVNDVDAASEFYTRQLGFVLKQRWGPAFAILARGDLELWLSGPESSAARAMPDGRRPEPGGWNRLVLQVADLAAESERLRAAGVRLRSELISGPGGKQLLLEDVSGNPVELFEPA
jgi:catechol 2,3-dioxygenase-like lactoylglutathione lyase family enzyme